MRRLTLIISIAAMTISVLALTLGVAYASYMFPDVSDNNAHSDNITWAAQNGVVNGYDNGNFGPNDNITRGQATTMLRQLGAHRGPVIRLSPYYPDRPGEFPCQFSVIDQNNRGSGAADATYTVDGGEPVGIPEIPRDGYVNFNVNAEGMVSVLIDGIAQGHAHTVEGCNPSLPQDGSR